MELPCCNGDNFQIFLNELSNKNPTKYKVVILDNGHLHEAKSLIIPQNIAVIFLPHYSPQLNPAGLVLLNEEKNDSHNLQKNGRTEIKNRRNN